MADQQPLVLIVDDDGAVRDALRFNLQLNRLDVRTYQGGAELLMDPDLPSASCVIVYDRLLQMDCFELLRRLQKRDLQVPVILLASHATAELRTRAVDTGVRLVLEKPLIDNALVNGIMAILKRTL
jgi:two-component system response regulator FixJ